MTAASGDRRLGDEDRRLGDKSLAAAEYAELVSRVQAQVMAAVPPGGAVLVVSKGDAALVDMPGLAAAHFPQDSSGGYAGHHPRDSAAAIAQLQELHRQGAKYLVIPATARWWLDYYSAFAEHLAVHGESMSDVGDACLIYELGRRVAEPLGGEALARPQASIDQMRDYLENLISTETSVVVLEAGVAVAASLAPVRAAGFATDELRLIGDGSLTALRRLAEGGAEYLVVPRSADEWLERHADVTADIEASCRKVADQRHLCRVFALTGLREEA
jgi:hypothetical protein